MVLSRLIVSLCVAALVSTAISPDAEARRRRCRNVEGEFTSHFVPPPECTSPVGICTSGSLTGDIEGSYSFTMTSMVPSTIFPGAFEYTGTSVITTADGEITGEDRGLFIPSPTGLSATIIAVLTFTSGATGGLGIYGALDFLTGQASGIWSGQLCKLR